MAESIVSIDAYAVVSAHIAVTDGKPTTTTRDIAEVFGKRHDNVLQIVRERIAEAGAWGVLNFQETVFERQNPSGGEPIKSPVIRMTEKGFMFVVQKFTGKKAVHMQIAYIEEFERMRDALTSAAPALPAPTALQATPRQPLALPRPASIPADVQPLLDAAVWRMVGQAHSDITDWAERRLAYACSLDHAPSRPERAARTLAGFCYEDWLSSGEQQQARTLVMLFEAAQMSAQEALLRLNKLLGADGKRLEG